MNKIINEFEYIANKSLDNNEGIHVIFLADLKENNKHYYFVCSEDNEFQVKHIILPSDYKFENISSKLFKKKYVKKLKLAGDRRLRSLINYCYNYEVSEEGLLLAEKKKTPKFYCYLPINNRFYEFDDTSEKEINNGFYDFINYLLIYSHIDNNYFNRKDLENETLIQLAALLDDEIAYHMELNSNKKSLKIRKKFNKDLIKKQYNKTCDDLCSMMSNYELVMTILITDYVHLIAGAINKIKPETLNWDGILKNKKIKYENIYNLINNKQFVNDTPLTIIEKEKIIDNLDINHQIDIIMESLKNEEIMELASKTNNWNAKLNIMKYIHGDE